MLTFVIPTRKRSRELSIAIKSIAEQVVSDVKIIVLYNAPEEDTLRAIKRASDKWPFITSIEMGGDPCYSDKFREMFRIARNSEWVWTFGDDDKLQPGALKFMQEKLKTASPELSFIHVAERKRAAGTNHTFTGRLIDLCCTYGWLEMTGFITGNITRGVFLGKCADLPDWDFYAESAFVQSCSLLEVLLTEQAQFIDMPLVDTQEAVQTPECAARWDAENIGERYFYVANAIKSMMKRGLIKKKLPVKFFRYMNYHLWDRYITYYISFWINKKEIWEDDWADHVRLLSELIDDEETAKDIRSDIETAIRLVRAQAALDAESKSMEMALRGIYNRRSGELYPYTFTQPLELVKEAA